MKLAKAVITAAAPGQRTLPLQSVIDRDGEEKVVLSTIVEEAVRAGIEEICLVVCPGDEEAYRRAAPRQAGRLHFVVQKEPRGYGDAVLRARVHGRGGVPAPGGRPPLHRLRGLELRAGSGGDGAG